MLSVSKNDSSRLCMCELLWLAARTSRLCVIGCDLILVMCEWMWLAAHTLIKFMCDWLLVHHGCCVRLAVISCSLCVIGYDWLLVHYGCVIGCDWLLVMCEWMWLAARTFRMCQWMWLAACRAARTSWLWWASWWSQERQKSQVRRLYLATFWSPFLSRIILALWTPNVSFRVDPII